MRFFERDLRVKITAIVILVLFVALGSAITIASVLANSFIRTSIEESLLDSARMTGNLLEVALERRAGRVELLANSPTIDNPDIDPEEKQETLSRYMEYWPISESAVLLDPAGNVICSTGGLDNLTSASGASWFEDARQGDINFTYVYDEDELVQISAQAPVLAVSAPVRDEEKQIFAYLVSFTGLSDIWKAINSVEVKETGHGFLIEEGGAIIAGHLFTIAGKAPGEESPEVRELEKALTWGQTGVASVSYDGVRYMVSYTPVQQPGARYPKMDWDVGVVIKRSEAYAPARELAWILIGLAIGIILLSVVPAVLLARSICRPINELVENAEKIGAGDLTGEVVIRSRDQIGTLAAACLRMRDNLRGALSETGYDSDKIAMLASEQSAATQDMFDNTEEIVESVVILARNIESLTQKMRKITDHLQKTPESALAPEEVEEVKKLLQEAEILAEVGASKAVEIASASQDQRGAARDIAVSARRLSEMADQLKDMVGRFKV